MVNKLTSCTTIESAAMRSASLCLKHMPKPRWLSSVYVVFLGSWTCARSGQTLKHTSTNSPEYLQACILMFG